MADYVIERVSEHEPRKWHSDKFNSDTFYIKVKLAGVDKAVEIGKKNPDALKAGDTVSGTIQPKPDFEADGFKADPKPFGGGGKSTFQPKDEEAIARSVALKGAIEFWNNTAADTSIGKTEDAIIKSAEKFLSWLKERPEAPKDNEPKYVDEGF